MKFQKIGFDNQQKMIDNKNRPIKAEHYEQLKNYFERFDLELPSDTVDFRYTFVNEFEKKHKNNFPRFVTISKMLELSSIDLNDLTEIEIKYHSIPEVDIDKDYTISATTERQVQALELSRKVLALFLELEALFGPMNQITYNEAAKIFKGLITNDKRTGERTINVERIKNI